MLTIFNVCNKRMESFVAIDSVLSDIIQKKQRIMGIFRTNHINSLESFVVVFGILSYIIS